MSCQFYSRTPTDRVALVLAIFSTLLFVCFDENKYKCTVNYIALKREKLFKDFSNEPNV